MPNKKPYKSRKKIFLLGSGAGYGVLIVCIIVGLISVPIGLDYFGPVRYGVWLVISSILAYLRISSLGIESAVLTLIGQFPTPPVRRVILRRSIGLLTASSLIFITLAVCVSRLFPGWIAILGKVPLGIQGEAAEAVLALGILFFLRLPVAMFPSTFSGLQEVHWRQTYDGLYFVASLVALVATVLTGGSLVTLAIFTGIGGLAVGIASGIHLFLVHPEVRPRLTEKVAGAPSSQLIFTSGVRFFLMGIAILVIYNTDNLIISHYLGPQAVTPYAVTFILFSLGFSIITTVNATLWPMYAHAASSGEWEWVQQIYNHACHLLVILGGLLWVGGIAFAGGLINLWAGPVGYGGLLVVIALGGYGYIHSLINTQSMLLNGLNRNKNVVIILAIEAVFNLGISLALVRVLGIGGVALGTFLATLLTTFWFLSLDVHHQTEGKVKTPIKLMASHATAVLFPSLLAVYLLGIYGPSGWDGVFIKAVVIVLYLGCSWRISPLELRRLIWSTSRELLALVRRVNKVEG